MPGFKRRHLIGLGKKMVNECGSAAGVAYDKNRTFDLYPAKLRKQEMVQQQKDGGDHGPDKEKQNHAAKKQKMPVEFEQFPACFQSLQVEVH